MKYLVGIASLGMLMAMQSSANAGFIVGGHSIAAIDGGGGTTGPDADSTISFAVYQNMDGDWTNDVGFDGFVGTDFGGTVDAAAEYVYLYQVVNTDHGGSPEPSLTSLRIDAVNVTSAGYLDGVVLTESGVEVGGANTGTTNTELGDPGGPIDTPNDSAPTQFVDPGIIGITGAASGTTTFFNNINIQSDRVTAAFTGLLAAGDTSEILWFTSDYEPTIRDAHTFASQASGGVASPVPTPASFALMLLGLPCVGLLRRKKVAA